MILLVDNDIDDIDLLKDAFNRNGFRGDISFVSDGTALVNLLSDSRLKLAEPEIILLDLSMPNKNGFEALSEIKSNPELRSIPIIIYSSSTSKQDELTCFHLGCNLFIIKPTTVQEYDALVRLLMNYLGLSDLISSL